MLKKHLTTIAAALLMTAAASAQTVKDFKDAVDSLQVSLTARTGLKAQVKANKVVRRGLELDFHFTQALGEFSWRPADVGWLRSELARLMPESCSRYSIGAVYVGRQTLESLAVPDPGNDGIPAASAFRTTDPKSSSHIFISRADGQEFSKGLSGRDIALWQSHGRYFEEKTDRWEWQRPPLFQTVEDMYTQSYVLPFLIPMLENAGAYVMTPRERDTQTFEVVADNDPAFEEGRGEKVRIEGRYSETGTWSDAGVGFADAKVTYSGKENPFRMGTARQARCQAGATATAQARWTPEIPERGSYAVYISYKSLPHSTPCASYTVRHLGGESRFIVNQRMGGGTWIHLGTFDFDEGAEGCVILDNSVPEGWQAPKNAVITADAVRFGGGYGKIARGHKDSPVSEYSTSGLPSFTEGAYYWMQWAGCDSTILSSHEDDYTSDYADRGAWVGWMSGGSRTNPKAEGLGIPVDLSLAFHTDAGTTPNDSIVGTLAIYTLKCDGSDKFPDGENRLQQRTYADFVQTQVVGDIRSGFNPEWRRRGLWDRSYSESRTATVPAMILELLSHQNFADMKFGLDPTFRFTVCRAVYKGILKFLSARYGCAYAVQPLPVNSFATSFSGDPADGGDGIKVLLSWKETVDTLESTAAPTGYILQTRIDDGVFDEGTVIKDVKTTGGVSRTEVTVAPGHIYSYRITAFNEGGKSFPSETLSVGVPENGNEGTVLVVNNFTRLSAPAWHDTPDHAGFDNSVDGGVAYGKEINFLGEQYEYRRTLPWLDDDNPGFGGSWTDKAGEVYAGNTFDYCGIHGKALMAAGYAFHSAGADAFSSDADLCQGDKAVDLVCGRQVTTVVGTGKVADRFQVFPQSLQDALKEASSKGVGLIVSGAYIGTDVWDSIYPVKKDSLTTVRTKEFVEKTLGYRWMTGFASRKATVRPMKCKALDLRGKVGAVEFHKDRNPLMYNVENPDGIVPSGKSAGTFLRYTDTCVSAGVCFEGEGYRAVSLGFPIETVKRQDDIDVLMENIMKFIDSRQ
jgi:hypothetical protein